MLHSNLKTYSFSFFVVCSYIWCQSGEIVVGQADFSSPPDWLSCKVWETFVNSDNPLFIEHWPPSLHLSTNTKCTDT